MIVRWLLLVSCLLLALHLQDVVAKEDKPTIHSKKIKHTPTGLFYFDDTDTILFNLRGELHRSTDGGEKWEVVEGNGMKGNVKYISPHPFDKKKAYALGLRGKHWITKDQAKTWEEFEVEQLPAQNSPPLSFHGWDSSKVILQTEACLLPGVMCSLSAYYTTDDFKTVKPLREDIYGCSWAVGNPQFAEGLGASEEIGNRVHCVVRGLKSAFGHANRLVYSDDFFKSDEGTEAKLQQGRPVSGIISAAPVKKHLVVAAKSQGTEELALYVTDDARVWHRAEFGAGEHQLKKDAYTILESTNYSIQVDVQSPTRSRSMGVLFTSNSNGTYFTPNIEHTNRNQLGFVDFEKVADIQGIVLVNTVKNWEHVLNVTDGESRKEVISKISFDDGRTFQSLKVGDKNLHLHSVTTYNAGMGRVFSSPAPGIVMGVGNTGDYLKKYTEGNLYVSDDAGVTWRHALDGPHRYEFGDQGAVLVAVPDEDKTNEVKYSINHGKEWQTAKLDEKVYLTSLETTPDSTSLKFLLVGSSHLDRGEHIIYSLDFSNLHERKCKKSDFEKWPARLDENGKPDCLMGHKQFFQRRKADADCFVDEEFKDPEIIYERCKCTAEDFECDFNFKRSEDRKDCVPAVPLTPKQGQCKKSTDKFKGPSGWRLIPGNACIRDGGENLDKEIERPCGETSAPPNEKIKPTKKYIDGKKAEEYYYLERSSSSTGTDETIILRTDEHKCYISHDHGKSWEQPKALKGEKIVELIPHPYYNDGAWFITDSKKGFWTINRGQTIESFKAPELPVTPSVRENNLVARGISPLTFHQEYKDWLIWTGAVDCDGGSSCNLRAYISENRGEDWKLFIRSVRKCEFMGREGRENSKGLVLCEQHEGESQSNPRELVSIDREEEDEPKVLFNDVTNFASMAEYVVVASRDPNNTNSLRASTSVDGRTFADAQFPVNLNVPVQNAYTVLESSTHAIFLHVTVNTMHESQFGSLIKSNSNGTLYVLSLDAVNRNDMGYADFEKMQGLEGVMVANVVGNVEAVTKKGAVKQLKTMITHNDGAQWDLLPPPEKDAEGKSFGCSVTPGRGVDGCSLHLHGYTERRDPRDTYSSASAIGLMMGTGNVGAYLTSKDKADTFMTRDGGITWKAVKKGRYLWEYGDSGSVIVIVPDQQATKTLYYSTNEGESWTEFKFSDVDMEIKEITTVPSDTSKNFLLWGKDVSKSKIATVNLDFSGLRDRECHLDESGGDHGDYEIWMPKHPRQEGNCLFGHTESYHRKKLDADCWNNWREPHVHSIGDNCTCTRHDYECDYNYEPQSDGSCALVAGLDKPDAIATCKANPEAIEYWEPTGYRRIPLTTCQGGLNLDHIVSKPCPSKEKEYQQKHGISGLGLFFAIVIPITLAAAAGYYVYNKWDGKFGQIRLGENGSVTSQSFLTRDSPVVMVPIAIIAGVVAVAKALPLLVTSLWRSASGYARVGRSRPYSTRGSFAARRGDYTSVVDDEDELLGVVDAEGDEEDEI